MPPEILGPFGALVAALIAVGVLWRNHERNDRDVIAQRDRAMAGWEAQTKATNDVTLATNKLAEAVERRAKRDAEVRRASDKS